MIFNILCFFCEYLLSMNAMLLFIFLLFTEVETKGSVDTQDFEYVVDPADPSIDVVLQEVCTSVSSLFY